MAEDARIGTEGIDGEGRAADAVGRPGLRTGVLVLIGLILLGWALHAMAVVMVPLVASVLIALAIMPVRDAVRARVPERFGWLGVVAAMTVILLILAVFFGGLWLAAQRVVGEIPAGPGEIVEQLGAGEATDPIRGAEAGAIAAGRDGEGSRTAPRAGDGGRGAEPEGGEPAAGATQGQRDAEESPGAGRVGPLGGLPAGTSELLREIGNRAAGAAGGVAVTILNSALSIVAGLVLIFFLTLLILIESDDWRLKLQTVARAPVRWRLNESVGVIAGKVRAYLVVRAVLGIVTAALYAAWLWFFGVGLILVWALLTFLLNFIPTLGSLIAGALPVIYALLTQDLGTALLVGAGILVIEQVMGNYVDPRLAGNHIAISPLVILLSLLFWGWIWGIAGALLAVPVTVALVVLGSYVPALRPWSLLLSDRTTMRGLDDATRSE